MDSLTQSGKKRGRPKKDKSFQPPPEEEPETPKMRGRQHQQSPADEKYVQWKSVVPVLYDWLANHNLVGPPAGERNLQKSSTSLLTDGSVPNTLVIANCDIVKARVAASEHISQFNDESRSPFVKKYKTIIHPGEVNRIRELPQHNHIVATHSDTPDVYIWDIESQANRHAVLGAVPSRPDMVLTGHQENAEFALAMCPTEPYVLSGGKDKSVVFWSIQDHISASATDSSTNKPSVSRMSISKENGEGPRIGPRGVFQGHDDTVEDVQFCPKSSQEFCSVGDDSCLILWDARSGTTPAVKVEKAHDADLHCVDWSPFDENYILTGSADNSVRMFDRRNLSTSGGVGSPVHKFEGHSAAVLCVQWSPDNPTVFGSAAEDGLLNIWNYAKVGQREENEKGNSDLVPGLLFQHAGHRDKVVDFHFNAYDPWTIVSVSDDCDTSGGGGTLQIWRMTDLLYRPRDEVLAELYEFKSHVSKCVPRP
ncbi:hypothetical protein V2J09_012347 [Rumex salicifolius]